MSIDSTINNNIAVSIIVPLFNEKENVNIFYSQLISVMEKLKTEYEVIFVDDGSTDGTAALLKEVARKDEKVKAILLRRNFGQTAAMAAGFDYSRGNIVIPMDGDLQNDPNDIPALLNKIEKGFDVVSGWRKDRKDTFINRILPSIMANWMISKITGVCLHDYGCTLKAYKKHVINHLNLYGEMHRFLPALASRDGARVTEIKVNHRSRRYGTTKYGISRSFKVILDLITVKFLLSYSTKPMRLLGSLGFTAVAISFVSGLVSIYMKLADNFSLNRNPLFLLSVIVFFMGMQLIYMGLIAEINVRTYHESQNKSIYTIKEIFERSK